MLEQKGLDEVHAHSQCRYLRRDSFYCPEVRMDESLYCFWHNPNAPRDGHDLKERLETKVKIDPNCEGYKLAKTDLHDAWLTETNFNDSDFRRTKLTNGHLFGISLKGADLLKTNLSSANLRHADLREANLLGINIENSRIDNINWGSECVILHEILAIIAVKQKLKEVACSKYKDAEEVYLTLKNHFNSIGNSQLVGKFFYREMIAQRKQAPLFSAKRLFTKMADVSCGYGEKIPNILFFSMAVVIINAFLFGFFSISSGDSVYRFSMAAGIWGNIKTYFLMLYYSTVTFTTLGYGDYAPASAISKALAGFEAFIGPFLVALFVITVSKNLMSR